MTNRVVLMMLPAIFAVYVPTCRTPEVRPTKPVSDVQIAELWEQPADIAAQDLFAGQWGSDHAPDPKDVYTYLKAKRTGMNPGMKVKDSRGREWNVKQPPHDEKVPEGPIEVVVSRVLSAVGYHQPPVYMMPTFTLKDTFGKRQEPGGRFRLELPNVKERGPWSWQQNPFVGTKPYQGLLVILMMLNSSDLKNENNSLYEVKDGADGPVKQWFVVRDLGISLGAPGKVWPPRGDPAVFEQHGFIAGVQDGFVMFDYDGYHKELVDHRITSADVHWASELVGQLSSRQWRDAFRAGGYDQATSDRFIQKIAKKIDQGRALRLGPIASARP